MHFFQLESGHQKLALKLFWQLSLDAVLLPRQSSSSGSPSIISHCIFYDWTSSVFLQTFSGFSLKMVLAVVNLTTQTSYLSRGQKLSMQVTLFGSQTLNIKASFPCWSVSCLWGSFLIWVMGSASLFEKWKHSRLCQRGKKLTLNTECRLNSLSGI